MIKVFKIGGNIVDNPQVLEAFLQMYSMVKEDKILIHGGGKLASQLSEKLSLEVKMHNGRRITDSDTLDVALMTYGGLINKKIVATLQKLNVNAIGLSGADANVIKAVKRPVTDIDFGFVGDVTKVDAVMVKSFTDLGLSPVFCALTHDGNSQMLNTNADTIASEVASALAVLDKVELIYIFEKPGVLLDVNDNESVIENIDKNSFNVLKNKGVVDKGMLPKIENCLSAIDKGVKKVIISDISYLENNQNKHSTIQ